MQPHTHRPQHQLRVGKPGYLHVELHWPLFYVALQPRVLPTAWHVAHPHQPARDRSARAGVSPMNELWLAGSRGKPWWWPAAVAWLHCQQRVEM
eukprot:4115094-Prymnesium_polylepis.2